MTHRIAFRASAACALAVSLAACGTTTPAKTPEPSATPTRVITASDLTKAPTLVADDDFDVVAELPSTLGGDDAYWDALISRFEAVGTVGESALVLYDLRTKSATTLADLRGAREASAVSFSPTHIVWVEGNASGGGAWSLRAYDREGGSITTLATEKSHAVKDGSHPLPYATHLDDGQVYLVAPDSERLPTTSSAYRIPIDGSGSLTKVATNVTAIVPDGDDLTLLRKGRFFVRDLETGTERPADPERKAGKTCGGAASQNLLLECDVVGGRQRLTVVDGDDRTEIRLPKPNPDALRLGAGYYAVGRSWVVFTFDDQAYALNVESGELGRFKGAQFVNGPGFGDTIQYAETLPAASTEPRPPTSFVQLAD